MNAFLTCVSMPAVIALTVWFCRSDISNTEREPRVVHPALVFCASLILLVGFFGAVGLTFRSASLWANSYWLHDMRTGDGVRFAAMEPAAYADLKKRDSRVADDISPSASMVLVLKSASKEAAGYSTQDSRQALGRRAQAEAASAQPLR